MFVLAIIYGFTAASSSGSQFSMWLAIAPIGQQQSVSQFGHRRQLYIMIDNVNLDFV